MDRRITRQLVQRAREQHGLLQAADVDAVDPGRSLAELVRTCAWQEVLPGVVAPAAVEITTDLLESAAMLWVPTSQLSHQSAARRSGFWVPDDDAASISVPFESTARDRDGIRVSRTRQLPAQPQT